MAIPAWQRVKDKILDKLYNCNDILEEYHSYSTDSSYGEWKSADAFYRFISAVIGLYILMKVKIQYQDDRFKALNKMDKYVGKFNKDGLKKKVEWINYYNLLVELIEESGVTKIEITQSDPENAILEGVSVK